MYYKQKPRRIREIMWLRVHLLASILHRITTKCADRSPAHRPYRPLTPTNLRTTEQTPLNFCCHDGTTGSNCPPQWVALREKISKSFAKVVPLSQDVVIIEWPSEELAEELSR
jgi:hypothetical protein